MKLEIDISDVACAYLKELALNHETTESDVVEGLLMGYSLRKLLKLKKKKKKKVVKNPYKLSKKKKEINDFTFGGETFTLPTTDKS